jgi:hypothetical protein
MTDTNGAEQRLDELDLAILDQVRVVHEILDPPPADLDIRSRFAIALDNVDIEISRLYDDALAGAGARAAQPARTVTFEATSMTIMITVAARTSGLRVEGWLAPPAALRVELRTADASGGSRQVFADDDGRFVFDDVPPGLTQLAVRQAAGATVVTPPVSL